MEVDGVSPSSPGYRRAVRRQREREFIEKYRQKEAEKQAKADQERARRAYTRKLRHTLAEQQQVEQQAKKRTELKRNKAILRRENCRARAEVDENERIMREVLRKRHQQQLQSHKRRQEGAGGEGTADRDGNEANNNSDSVAEEREQQLSVHAVALIPSRAASMVVATAPQPSGQQQSLRHRLRQRMQDRNQSVRLPSSPSSSPRAGGASSSPRAGFSSSPRSAAQQHAEATRRWVEKYRQRERVKEAKQAIAAQRRAANVAQRESLRQLQEQETLRQSHQRSQAIIADKQVQDLMMDGSFKEHYGLSAAAGIGAFGGRAVSAAAGGALTAWDFWEDELAAFDGQHHHRSGGKGDGDRPTGDAVGGNDGGGDADRGGSRGRSGAAMAPAGWGFGHSYSDTRALDAALAVGYGGGDTSIWALLT
jgi:hypothetical protein